MQYKILSIGNSFSTDATTYLHQMAACDNIDTLIGNLYIGGCNLQTHWENIEQNNNNYLYEENGHSSEKFVTIKSTLQQENWDIITLQQASHDSGILETYHPFFENIFSYIKKLCPQSEIVIHQTWAYEKDSTHSGFANYNNSQEQMYQKLCTAYQSIANLHNLRIIPSGDIVHYARTIEPFIYENGGISLCRDGFHMDLFYGRYLIAATWFVFLLKGDILKNDFVPHVDSAKNMAISDSGLQILRSCVDAKVFKANI